MTRPCASRTLLSELSPWAMTAHAVGNPGRPGRADVAPPRPFRRSQLCTLCWPALLRRPISGALSTRPQRRRRRWPDSKNELLPSRDALRAWSNRARRTPRSWRGLPPRRSPTLGVGAFRRRGTAGFPESGLCSHRCGPWACGSGSPTRSAGVSMDAK